MKYKSLLVATLIAVTTTTVTFNVSAANIAKQLCEYTAADDKKRLRSFLKTNKLKIRRVFSGIQCNGKNLLEFADSRGSVKIGDLIISKLPKKMVAASSANLTNATLQAKAKARTGS